MALNITDVDPPAAVPTICICLCAFKHEYYFTCRCISVYNMCFYLLYLIISENVWLLWMQMCA